MVQNEDRQAVHVSRQQTQSLGSLAGCTCSGRHATHMLQHGGSCPGPAAAAVLMCPCRVLLVDALLTLMRCAVEVSPIKVTFGRAQYIALMEVASAASQCPLCVAIAGWPPAPHLLLGRRAGCVRLGMRAAGAQVCQATLAALCFSSLDSPVGCGITSPWLQLQAQARGLTLTPGCGCRHKPEAHFMLRTAAERWAFARSAVLSDVRARMKTFSWQQVKAHWAARRSYIANYVRLKVHRVLSMRVATLD